MPSRRSHRRQGKQPSVTTDLWCIETIEVVPAVVEEIFSDTRHLPLIVVSVASDTNTTRIDARALAADLADHAGVVVLDNMAVVHAFSDQVPTAFRCFGGAARVIWPSATREDGAHRHELMLTHPGDDPDLTRHRITALLRTRGFLPEEPPPIAPWNRTPDAAATTDDLTGLRQDLQTARDRLTALTAENTDLRKTVRSLTDQTKDLSQRLHGTGVYADPDRQLRYEIAHAWLTTYPEADRDQHPLATYTFGPDFLDSLDALDGVDRHLVVAACVDVLTRRAWDINGRQARQMRSSAAPGSDYLTRADGAAAWRCNIQNATASARRLMWWEIPDGTIELAKAALHDDVTIR